MNHKVKVRKSSGQKLSPKARPSKETVIKEEDAEDRKSVV